MQAKHAAAVGLPEKPYIHSEIDAILKLKHTDKPYRIFISRIMKDGSYGLAKPCPICEEAIRKETTIKKIEWTV